MKKTFVYLAAVVLSGTLSLAVSCSKDEAESRPGTDPTFPTAVSPVIEAGTHYTLAFEADRDWVVSIPSTGDAAKWFWIEDGGVEARSLRGEAGKATVVIATLPEVNYTATPSCEVTLTMKDSRGKELSKVIATLTIDKIVRSLGVYACLLDEFGDFAPNPDPEGTGLSYLYGNAPATELQLVWPEGRGQFSLPIMVESNFDWAVRGEVPAWIADMTVSGGTGGRTELRLVGDKLNYPLEGATETIAFGTEDQTFPVKVTIPPSKDIFITDFAKESKFNFLGEIFNGASSSYSPGVAHGDITAADGLRLYVFSEKEQWGMVSLSDDPEDIAWMNVTLAAWQKGEGIVQSRRLEVGVGKNPGDARKGYVLGLPASIAAGIGEAWELTDGDAIRAEYEKYIITAVSQEYNPGPITTSGDKDVLAGVGSQFSKYGSSDWQYNALKWEFGTTFLYNLTYSTAWGDEDWNLVFDTPYSSFKRFECDADFNQFTELTDNDTDWLTYDDRWKKIRMAEQEEVREGVVVFYDAQGEAIAAIHCVYDKNATPGGDEEGFKVAFAYPEMVEGAELVAITQENYEAIAAGDADLLQQFEENLGMGVVMYRLTYTSAEPINAMIDVSAYGMIDIMPYSGADWLTYEPMSDTQLLVNMTKPGAADAQTGMLQFYGTDWSMACVVYCVPAF